MCPVTDPSANLSSIAEATDDFPAQAKKLNWTLPPITLPRKNSAHQAALSSQAMEEWVSPNHKQLSAAYADDDIDFSELDQYLSRGRTSPLPSSTELSNHRPRETSVQYPAEFLSDSFNEAKKRRIWQHMDSPLLHRQKTSSPTNNHILGKASETVGGSSANMDDSTTYATEQVTSPYGEPCNFINGDMDFNPNDYFHFSDYGAHLSFSYEFGNT
ncbi:hypothetical protein KEM48_008604 [Puccinia striiformis f. sp. tritici PST-130]|nr:hypothetical protein KEM48_008604 [Puccinia striiformis f. sp. tritici PST-130]